jgi:hypothetical protein
MRLDRWEWSEYPRRADSARACPSAWQQTLVQDPRQAVPDAKALVAPPSANKSLGTRGIDVVVCDTDAAAKWQSTRHG